MNDKPTKQPREHKRDDGAEEELQHPYDLIELGQHEGKRWSKLFIALVIAMLVLINVVLLLVLFRMMT